MKGILNNEKNIVLIGGGGHCKSVLDTLIRLGSFGEIVITDAYIPANHTIFGYQVVGTDEILEEQKKMGFEYAFITIGSIKNPESRVHAYKAIKKIGFNCPSITDPSSVVAESASIGDGVFLGKMSVINASTVIEEHTIINTGAIVEHDCKIASFVHIAIGARICGGVQVGRCSFVGAGATVIQGVKIGMNSIIGAGSLVLQDVPDNVTVTGVWGGYNKPGN